MPQIAGTSTAQPEHSYTQEELLAALREIWGQKYHNTERIEEFHRNVMVGGRHLALAIEKYSELNGFQSTNDAYLKVAVELGTRTLNKLLDETGVSPADIGLIATTTVTGIAVPSLDARLMNRIPFNRHAKRMPLFGLGCMGGAAGIARVNDYLLAHPRQAAILLAVELCSLTLQPQDLSVANIIASGLFGDGAAAVLLVGDEHPLAAQSPTRVAESRSIFFPDTERVMGWDIVDSGFQIVLSPTVPDFAGEPLRQAVDEFLAAFNLARRDIDAWICHPGGPKVIQTLETALELDDGALDLTRESLRRDGNMSSVSVLFILEATIKKYRNTKIRHGLLLAMGPAFSAELLLLEWKN